ncbi:MAG: peptidase S8, partial [Gemmatimonadota bacterium]
MKPHLEVKLRQGAPTPDAPYWEDAIHDKAGTDTIVDRELTRVLARYAVPVLATRAYAPQGSLWSPDEIAAGFNRIYRLVLLENRTVPAQLLQDISLIPTIEYARLGAVGRTQLPQPEVAAMSVTTDKRSRDAIFLDEAQQYSLGDPSITIAVLDTGVWTTHPEFQGRMLPGRDFVDILDGAEQFLGDYLDA